MAYSTTVPRHKTREVGIGEHVLGGTNPISVQ
jgi:(E)-4-hydroxy-3-methylbut-2-enyl-diphosphate synthase